MDPLAPFDPSSNVRHGSFTHPSGPPPPYESVVEGVGADGGGPAGDAAAASGSIPAAYGSASQPDQASRDFEIVVADPVKQGEGVSAYVSYKVRSRVSLAQYERPSNDVIRRFRDFDWLAVQLARAHRGVIIPPLPEKNAVQKFTMTQEFIEERRRALQVFLNRVAAHPVLRTSKTLQTFLETPEDAFNLEVARTQVAAAGGSGAMGGAVKKLEGAVGWIKGLGTATTALVGARNPDAAEDPEYLKVRDYLVSLEVHLGEAARQAARLAAKEVEVGEALAEFGQSIDRLGRLEEGNVAEAFGQLAGKASGLAESRKVRCRELSATFEAPLKEAVRGVRAVAAVCADRAEALAALTTAQHDLDNKKVRWAKLRGTPGTPADKLVEAERDCTAAEAKVRESKMAYEELVSGMTEELNRWQKERSGEMHQLLMEFALTEAGLVSDAAKSWSSLLSELQAISGSSNGAAVAAGAGTVPHVR